jgi:uncharacterized protein (TIGR00730 family)
VKRVCVFAGSNAGARPDYAAAARALATACAARGLGIVYGGGSVGLMGALADRALASGAEVIGVIPAPLATKELAHAGLSELRVVESMHERKATMNALADGFIALPGGLGTFEETLEVLTWAQLGIHSKPVGVLNVAGYYDGLVHWLAHAVGEGFVRREHVGLLIVADDADDLLERFVTWTRPPGPGAWMKPTQT